MALEEAGDRRVIRPPLRRDHPKRDVLGACSLDHPRRRDPARVRVEQQRDHHRRVIGRPAAPIDAMRGVKRVEVHLLNRADHKPRQVILRQPLAHVGRHQKRLLAITRDKALSHARDRPKPARRHPTYATTSGETRSASDTRLRASSSRSCYRRVAGTTLRPLRTGSGGLHGRDHPGRSAPSPLGAGRRSPASSTCECRWGRRRSWRR